VVEVCRPQRPAQRGGRKTDAIDAVRAAREALATEHLIHPRRRGEREALRVLPATGQGAVTATTAAINHLKALIVSALEDLRAELRGSGSKAIISHCARLRARPAQSIEHRMRVRALRTTATRVQALRAEAEELEAEITELVEEMAPELLRLAGVGSISAAQVLVSWSPPGRFRSEAAFAAFAGTAPIPASSGLTNRYRLNRALHTIVLARTRIDPATKAYIQRRVSEGKTPREARRCLKRAVSRQLFKLLENRPADDLAHTEKLQAAA
jgi:transposase